MAKLKIAITGPESTGKSTLTEKLAEHYNSKLIPEMARSYLQELERPYEYSDLLEIAKTQKKTSEETFSNNQGNIFSDTSLLTLEIWSKDKFDTCDPWILNQIKKERFDLYLLCNTDTKWVYDKLREDEHRRKELFNMYEVLLKAYGFEYKIISGLGKERLQNAIKAIELYQSES